MINILLYAVSNKFVEISFLVSKCEETTEFHAVLRRSTFSRYCKDLGYNLLLIEKPKCLCFVVLVLTCFRIVAVLHIQIDFVPFEDLILNYGHLSVLFPKQSSGKRVNVTCGEYGICFYTS